MNSKGQRGLCLVFVGPSGSGKTTIMDALLSANPQLSGSISVTTRAPRQGEIEGIHYYFVNHEKFNDLISKDGLIEYCTVFDKSYGTPRAPLQNSMDNGQNVLLVLDWQGHLKLREALPGDVVGVYVMPPSLDDLKQRLENRGDSPELVKGRMDKALLEMSHSSECDYVVNNFNLHEAIDQVKNILEYETSRRLSNTCHRVHQ
jgi:guanylate kinase